MRCALFALTLVGIVTVPTSAPAQQNPFRLDRGKLGSVEVQYDMTGDLKGTAMTALAGDRMMTRSTSTGKFFGKVTTTESWALVTPDWLYSGNPTEAKGTRMPNMLGAMAKEFDGLSRAEKKRAVQNMVDMAEVMAQAFGGGTLQAEKRSKRTIAGEECQEQVFGSFSTCAMTKAPEIALHSSGKLMCVQFEQTATSVKLGGEVDPAVFELPKGMVFTTPKGITSPDSIARGFVRYLASEATTDSLTAAKARTAAARDSAVTAGNLTPTQSDSLQDAQMQAACEAMRDFDAGAMVASASNAILKAMADAAVDEAKKAAGNKLKGLFRKPKIP